MSWTGKIVRAFKTTSVRSPPVPYFLKTAYPEGYQHDDPTGSLGNALRVVQDISRRLESKEVLDLTDPDTQISERLREHLVELVTLIERFSTLLTNEDPSDASKRVRKPIAELNALETDASRAVEEIVAKAQLISEFFLLNPVLGQKTLTVIKAAVDVLNITRRAIPEIMFKAEKERVFVAQTAVRNHCDEHIAILATREARADSMSDRARGRSPEEEVRKSTPT